MIVISRVDLINKKNPEKKIESYNNGKKSVKTEPNYDVKNGDIVNVISESLYCYREGFFFIIKCKNGEIIFLDSEQTEIQFENLL
jgi:hypothetical protein